MTDSDYLMISGIQHFSFCKRQWALIHLEQQWEDNHLTIAGELAHERVHNPNQKQSKKGYFSCSALRVSSKKLKLSGICDLVEFYKSENGVSISGHHGKWTIVPIEFKHGKKELIADKIQLCCQAIALEELYNCKINVGYIFHVKSRSREEVQLNSELRELCYKVANEMHEIYERKITPLSVYSHSCKSCSLYDVCLPIKNNYESVEAYIKGFIDEENA